MRDKVSALEEELKKQRSTRDLENTLRLIARSIDEGKYTHEQLVRMLEHYRRVPDGISGSGGNAPPPSPELFRLHMHIHEPSRIAFSQHAIEQMKARRVSITDVYETIFRSVGASQATLMRETGSDGKYVVRGQDNLRVVFVPSKESITVLTVYAKS